jgi:hypothetical protein
MESTPGRINMRIAGRIRRLSHALDAKCGAKAIAAAGIFLTLVCIGMVVAPWPVMEAGDA